jgi:hypothetical protein
VVESDGEEGEAVGEVDGCGDAAAGCLQALKGLSVDDGQIGVAVDDGRVNPGQIPAGEELAELGAEVIDQCLAGLEGVASG